MEKSRIRRTVESFRKNRETIIRTWIQNHKPPVVYWLLDPLPEDIKYTGPNDATVDANSLEASCKFSTKQDSFGRRYIEVTIEGYPVWADPMHFRGDWPKEVAPDIPDEPLP